MTSFKKCKIFSSQNLGGVLQAAAVRINTLQMSSCYLSSVSTFSDKMTKTHFLKQLTKYPPIRLLKIQTFDSITVDERFQITVGNAAAIPQITLLSSVD